MSILTVDNVGLSFGAFDLFKGVSGTIARDSKIGLIGPNGVGKTSLLLILAGINPPTVGQVYMARGRRLGYLRQEAVTAFADRDNTVYSEMQTVFADLIAQQERLHELEGQMEAGDHTDEELVALLDAYGELQAQFDRLGGYDYDLRIQQTLTGLGLGRDAWNMPLNHLSGGQKTRALLARLLLEKPELLMLDEPTNHLDIEAVEWLERTLREWDGAVLIVSHDRYFLDNTVNTIWEMSSRGIEVYSGNYSSYLMQRQDRWEYYQRVFEEEKARLLKEVDFIMRNWVRASTHARALGLLRRLSRDLAVVENFGIMALRSGKKWSEFGLSVERHLDPIEAQRLVNAITMVNNRPPVIRPRLSSPALGATYVVKADRVTIGYPGNSLFTAHNLELRRGECAALIGPNGSGKTTFLKVLLEQLPPLQGRVKVGEHLKIGYFAQAHDALHGDHSVLDELQRHKEMHPQDARSYLAAYLFRGDDVFKPVDALSGGERARLALAILALEGSNFLLLDEPTNHLDIPAREMIQEVLDNYSGTILLVSHDRYLLDRLATQIWDLHDGQLRIFKGTYREYLLRGAASGNGNGAAAKGSNGNGARAGTRLILPPRPMLKGNDRETKRRIEALNQLEDRIREQEGAIQKLSRELQKAGEKQSFERVNQLSWQVAHAQATLDNLMSEWEKLAV